MRIKSTVKLGYSTISAIIKQDWPLAVLAILFLSGFVNVHKVLPPMLNFINNSGQRLNYIMIIIPFFCFWYARNMRQLDHLVKLHLIQRRTYIAIMVVNAFVQSLLYSMLIGIAIFLMVGLRQGATVLFFFLPLNLRIVSTWCLSLSWFLMLVSIMMTCLYQFVKRATFIAIVSVLMVVGDGLASYFLGQKLLVSRLPSPSTLGKFVNGGLVDFGIMIAKLIIIAIIILSAVVACKTWPVEVEER